MHVCYSVAKTDEWIATKLKNAILMVLGGYKSRFAGERNKSSIESDDRINQLNNW